MPTAMLDLTTSEFSQLLSLRGQHQPSSFKTIVLWMV